MIWSVDAATFLEESDLEMLALDIPPGLEGRPKSIHVSLLARQGSKVGQQIMLQAYGSHHTETLLNTNYPKFISSTNRNSVVRHHL